MRGEDVPGGIILKETEGSPPHARGRRSRAGTPSGTLRITPACAGKTASYCTRRSDAADHPRMRGEDHWGCDCIGVPVGSPPHARGRPLGGSDGSLVCWITPACAGKTTYRKYLARPDRDHPRMRGEDPQVAVRHDAGLGSPPHARGRQLDSPGNPTKPTISLPVFLHSQPSPLKRFLLWVLGL